MSPFEDRGSAFDTAFDTESKRQGTPALERLHNEAAKIVKNCGHNFDLMTTKLMAKTKRDDDMRYAIHEIFIRAIFKEVEPDKVPVRAAVRGLPGSKAKGDAGGHSHPATAANPPVPPASPSRMPGKRDPAYKATTIAAQEDIAIRLTMRKTFDGRDYDRMTPNDVLLYKKSSVDARICDALDTMYGHTWQHRMNDPLSQILKPSEFLAAETAAGV